MEDCDDSKDQKGKTDRWRWLAGVAIGLPFLVAAVMVTFALWLKTAAWEIGPIKVPAWVAATIIFAAVTVILFDRMLHAYISLQAQRMTALTKIVASQKGALDSPAKAAELLDQVQKNAGQLHPSDHLRTASKAVIEALRTLWK
jgi:hypothetical protein